jgi:predicted metal-dependent phosphoesterase TrpH
VATIWSKADIHIHTTYSADGTARVEQVLDYFATQTDIRVLAITDHDEIRGALKARRLAHDYGLDVIVGEEVSTQEGHLLALFIEHFVPPHRPAAETIAAIHAQGGLCIAAHPYGWLVPSLGWHGLRERCQGNTTGNGNRTGGDWMLDGIEGFNASLWYAGNNASATAAGEDLNLAICGGSDSHQLSTLGLGYTLFPGSTANDLRRALLMRQTTAYGAAWGSHRTLEYVGIKVRDTVRSLTDRSLKPSIP